MDCSDKQICSFDKAVIYVRYNVVVREETDFCVDK